MMKRYIILVLVALMVAPMALATGVHDDDDKDPARLNPRMTLGTPAMRCGALLMWSLLLSPTAAL